MSSHEPVKNKGDLLERATRYVTDIATHIKRRALGEFPPPDPWWLRRPPYQVTSEMRCLYDHVNPILAQRLKEAKLKNEISFQSKKSRERSKYDPFSIIKKHQESIACDFQFERDDFEGKEVITLGCGSLDLYYDFPVRKSVGIDPTFDALNKLNNITSNFPSSEFYSCFWESLPFDNASFDVAGSFNVLDHVDDAAQCIRETHRVLKPSGKFYLVVILAYGVSKVNYKHPYRFSLEHINELLSSYFVVKSARCDEGTRRGIFIAEKVN
jgi:ubiquinone/menaquinone biosynthesis C-methylase UbiE